MFHPIFSPSTNQWATLIPIPAANTDVFPPVCPFTQYDSQQQERSSQQGLPPTPSGCVVLSYPPSIQASKRQRTDAPSSSHLTPSGGAALRYPIKDIPSDTNPILQVEFVTLDLPTTVSDSSGSTEDNDVTSTPLEIVLDSSDDEPQGSTPPPEPVHAIPPRGTGPYPFIRSRHHRVPHDETRIRHMAVFI